MNYNCKALKFSDCNINLTINSLKASKLRGKLYCLIYFKLKFVRHTLSRNETESSWKSFFKVESLFCYTFSLKPSQAHPEACRGGEI